MAETLNGRQQAEALARLANPEPGFKSGDLVDIRTLGRAEVLAVLPGGLLRIRTANRCPVEVKAFICERVR